MRSVLRRLRAEVKGWTGVGRRARHRLDGTRAAVLMYHRVLPRAEAERGAVEPGMFVAPQTFERHLDWLGEHFEVLPLHEIVERLGAARSLPRGACAITFDDGWRDNLIHGALALERRGMPATVFVVSERVGTRGAFWPDEVSRCMAALDAKGRDAVAAELDVHAGREPIDAVIRHLKELTEDDREAVLERLRAVSPAPPSEERELLDWDEIARLQQMGIDIESHGASHAILTGLPPAAARSELERSLHTLRAHGCARHQIVAYPNGGWNREIAREAAALGYRAGVTTQRGLAGASHDPLALPRVGLHDDVSRSRAEFLAVVPGAA